MDHKNQLNKEIRNRFYQLMGLPQIDETSSAVAASSMSSVSSVSSDLGSDSSSHLDDEFGTSQWSDAIYNILTKDSNCSNDCVYCYMKRIRHNLLGVDIENLVMDVDSKKVKKGWFKTKKPKYIMFPTSHDIFEEFMVEYTEVALKDFKSWASSLNCVQTTSPCHAIFD